MKWPPQGRSQVQLGNEEKDIDSSDLSKGRFGSLLLSMPPGRILISQAKLRARVRELGVTISRHYRRHLPPGEKPLFLGVMNGALFFFTDLLRAVDLDDVEISTLRVSSYAGTQSAGTLRGLKALGDSFNGRHVLIVDDILDTGLTLSALVTRLKELGAADVKTCILLEKRRKHDVPIKPDWLGFKIEDEFVVGYGLDLDGKYRALKQIRVLKTPDQ